jgi:hypothetical protein
MEIKIHDGQYPIIRAWIYGYGKEQVLSYQCYGCKDRYFCQSSNPLEKVFCETCNLKSGSITIQGSVSPVIEILGFKQHCEATFKRTRHNFNKVLKRDEYTCRYCSYNPRHSLCSKLIALHVDHVLPFSYGGKNSMDNLVTACADCNLCVSNKIFDSFIDKKIYIFEKRRKENKPCTECEWKEFYRSL